MTASVRQFPGTPALSPVDRPQRERAVGPSESILVQAPAGSGKTTLLAERFLRLLSTVDEPEQVLAITFTRAAVAEMRQRILAALRNAQQCKPAEHVGEERMQQAATAALEWSERRGWALLDDPAALNIQTIDGLALTIAQQTPLTSRLGPGFQPTEDAGYFYKRAAMRTLQSLEDMHASDPAQRQTAEAAATLLLHRDNRLQACAELLADMLKNRDQWGRVFPLASNALEDRQLDAELRPQLEGHLRNAIELHLRQIVDRLQSRKQLCQELVRMAQFAALTATNEIAACKDMQELPPCKADRLQQWFGLLTLVLTKTKGTPREAYQTKDGFPSGTSGQSQKAAAKALAAKLCEDDALRVLLHELRSLPPVAYTDEEWHVTKALLRLLHRGALELKLLFANSGLVDFTEVGLAAIDALAEERGNQPTDLAFALSARYQHLLVDEFQDTSRTQHTLLELLVNQWQSGDGRTVFCVGDPMQSIYLFRQAELRLFRHVAEHGLADVPLTFLKLRVNFRSQPSLIDAHNQMFRPIFAEQRDVEFVASQAYKGEPIPRPLQWHFFEAGNDPVTKEAQAAVEIIADAIQHGKKTAVLVRVKNHAGAILRLLRDRNIAYRATDMESLADRQEVLDVFALTRALLHPADRVAWLAILRGPWCGLGLASLDALAGERSATTVPDWMTSLLPRLPLPEQCRIQRVQDVLQSATANRHAERLPALVWQAWRALGGEHCVNAEQLANVHAYFALLDRMDAEGQTFRCDTIDDAIQRLCAKPNPDPLAQVEVLTIHKAKGREFDVVIVPQMHRPPYHGSTAAVDWIEDWPDDWPEDWAAGQVPWYLAPIAAIGDDKSALNAWICKKKKAREHAEVKRLFYVAATRAKSGLHLMAAVRVKDGKLVKPRTGTLLDAAWTVAAEHAEQQLLPVDSTASGVVGSIAASDPVAAKTVQRLSDEWFAKAVPVPAPPSGPANQLGIADEAIAAVSETGVGSELHADTNSRIAGTVLHTMLEHLARRRASGESWDGLAAWAAGRDASLRQLMLAEGMPASAVTAKAEIVLSLLQNAVNLENGRWVLEDHPGSQTEFSLHTIVDGEPAGLRMDRVFAAGAAPLSLGHTHLWIVDYKSAAPGGRHIPAFLGQQQAAYGPQMEKYAKSLRVALRDPRPIVCALYFPAVDAVQVVAELPEVD